MIPAVHKESKILRFYKENSQHYSKACQREEESRNKDLKEELSTSTNNGAQPPGEETPSDLACELEPVIEPDRSIRVHCFNKTIGDFMEGMSPRHSDLLNDPVFITCQKRELALECAGELHEPPKHNKFLVVHRRNKTVY